MEKQDRPLISIIVPVFNVEAYLRKCLDSILAQTLSDFEILCVDDASSDGSGAILSEYAEKDDRVHVTTFERNQGISVARNHALDLAKGEYIYMIDSDDWIDPTYLEEMYSHAVATGQDVVINCEWVFEYEIPYSGWKPGWKYDFLKDDAAFYPPVLIQSHFYPSVWTRLYRTSYLRDNGICFPPINRYEDNYFVALAEVLQERSYVFHGPTYHYMQRRGSLNRGKEKAFKHFLVFDKLHDALKERGVPPSGARRFICFDYLWVKKKEQFSFLRSFFQKVENDVLAAPELYTCFDCFVLKVILSCRDYAQFRLRYFPNMKLSWKIRVVMNMGWPKSSKDVLDGKWKVF